MIELKHDALEFSFPEVHPDARLTVDFQRTLRIPDDERTYRLPPGLGRFPLRHVDDAGERVPAAWLRRGGVMLPMYRSEAMWLSFTARSHYPFVLKAAAGKVNAPDHSPAASGARGTGRTDSTGALRTAWSCRASRGWTATRSRRA